MAVSGRICIAFAVVLEATWCATATAAPKTDVVVLANGDRVTGEVKGLEHNQLRFSTDDMGTVYIEWDKIAQLQSNQILMLESADGSMRYGTLIASQADRQLQVQVDAAGREETLEMASVIRAQPIESGSFIDRLNGYINAGLDFAKANDRRTLNFGGGLSSRTRMREWSIDGSADVTDDSGPGKSERYVLDLAWRRFRKNRYFIQGFGGLERNTELDLRLRALAGAAYGRYFVQTNLAEWGAAAGLAYSQENYEGSGATGSVEGVLTTSFSLFRYDFPEMDVGGKVEMLPSLTQSGRYRGQADLRAKYEFVDDLYLELRLYGSYDSKPPSETSQKSDYGAVTSLGYSF